MEEMTLFLLLIIILLVVLITYIFLKTYPHFGKKSSSEKINRFQLSKNYVHGKFVNQIPTTMNMDVKSTFTMFRDFIKKNPNRTPKATIPMEKLDRSKIHNDTKTKITWFGHSALLIEIGGKTLLIDPMFGNAPSPFPQFGGRRFSGELPFEIEDLPQIDAVILSHDHYDHLDYRTIIKLKNKVNYFIVPLGVGNHLEKWSIEEERISENDWWDELSYEGLKLVCTPARHFSGRSVNDRNSTLWCSWIIISEKERIYFSGDSGYAPHFKEIGEKYGPFDAALMECGQYDERWAAIHMLPEETVQAFTDVKGKLLIPIHWGAFTLAFHDWYDPIERVLKAANKIGVTISTPKIGEIVTLGADQVPKSIWWKS